MANQITHDEVYKCEIEDLYKELSDKNPTTIFVAPPIRFAYKRSDYLYLFYKDLFKSSVYHLLNVSTARYCTMVLSRVLKKPSILHHHWFEFSGLFTGVLFIYKFLCVALYKLLGGKLVWTIHNKMPIDGNYSWINYKFRCWMARRADLLHIECASVLPEIASFFKVDKKKFRVIPHPDYPAQLMPRASAVEAINHRFNVNIKMQDRLFLMIGHISAYKQIEEVCEIFADEPIQKKLVIAGPVKKGQLRLYKRLRKISRAHDNILLIPQFIKEESVPEFLNAADFLIFNFRNLITSGGVVLARSYNKSVIIPREGCLQELEGDDLLFFDTRKELKEIIRNH